MRIIKIKDKNYLISTNNNMVLVYLLDEYNNFHNVLRFNSGYGLCSNAVIQGISFYGEKGRNLCNNKEWFSEFIKKYFSTKVIITVQNTTKSNYTTLKNLGFKDYYRLPAEYINSYGSNGERKDFGLSIMIYTNKNLKPSLNKTMELITGINSSNNDVKVLKYVLCTEPVKFSNSVTKNKIYKVIEERDNLIQILDNRKNKKLLKSSRFKEVIIND